MKVFILAVSVMLLTGLFVIWSGWYVDRLCEDLIYLLERMPAERDLKEFGESYEKFEKKWYGKRKCIKMIIGAGAAEAVERGFIEMGMRYLGDDMVGYLTAKEHLADQLKRMRGGEKLTWETML